MRLIREAESETETTSGAHETLYARPSSTPMTVAHDGRQLVNVRVASAWPQLQALHRSALREQSAAPHMVQHPKSATNRYAKSLGGALGYFARVAPSARSQMFGSLVDHVAKAGSMEGLESLYAAGLQHTATRGGALHQRAVTTARAVGLPKAPGGGLRLLYPKQYKGAIAPHGKSKTIPDPYKMSQGPVAQFGEHTVTGAGSGTLTEVGGDVPNVVPSGDGSKPFDPASIDKWNDRFGSEGLGVNINVPERPGRGSRQNPAGAAWSNNPGGSAFQLQEFGNPNAALGVQQFGLGTSAGAAEGALSGNPGGKTVNMSDLRHKGTGDALTDKVIGDMDALAARRNDPTNPNAGLGPNGRHRRWTPQGGQPGDPQQDPTPDGGFGRGLRSAIGSVIGGIAGGAAYLGTRTTTLVEKVAPAEVAKDVGEVVEIAATDIAEQEAAGVAIDAEAAAAPEEFEAIPFLIAMGVGIVLGGAAGAATTPPSGPQPSGGGGKFQGVDSGSGGGPAGPKTRGYMPSEDDTRSPVGPRSFGSPTERTEKTPTSLNEATPAPDDPRRGGGPRSFVERSSNDVMPNPEESSPGTPHSMVG